LVTTSRRQPVTVRFVPIGGEPALRRRQGVKLHDNLIILHEQMLDDELSAAGQNLAELRESPRQEVGFRLAPSAQHAHIFLGSFHNLSTTAQSSR
jgi:hypothetical protein